MDNRMEKRDRAGVFTIYNDGAEINIDCEWPTAMGFDGALIALTPADLLALGYVPEPVWRDAEDDPPPTYLNVLCHDGARIATGCRLTSGEWDSDDSGLNTHKIEGWRELPALPGKGE